MVAEAISDDKSPPLPGPWREFREAMGEFRSPEPVLPLLGLLGRAPWPAHLASHLAPLLGERIACSPVWPFAATRYYEPEMGGDLRRGFLLFAPADPGRLADWKLGTQALERQWRTPHGRRINLDPGYLSATGLFLASTKPGLHRVYLRDGIYAELTLWRAAGGWTPLPWTFPEFREPTYYGFLDHARRLVRQRRRARRSEGG
ncbi:MAG: DUF4416 family protein [Candidatus Eisenbacteria bacterium]|nr:DUF4416 family protein [Candidatus Eisenbacteria bacterium]